MKDLKDLEMRLEEQELREQEMSNLVKEFTGAVKETMLLKREPGAYSANMRME